MRGWGVGLLLVCASVGESTTWRESDSKRLQLHVKPPTYKLPPDPSTGGGGVAAVAHTSLAANDTKSTKADEKDQEEQVRLGIEIASRDERERGILRCYRDESEIDDVVDGTLSKRKKGGWGKGRQEVYVGIYALNFGADGGLENGFFYADFLLYTREGPAPLPDVMGQLAFSNAKTITQSNFGPGVTRVSGTFFFSPDLRSFPFDSQRLPIVLEQREEPITSWIFVTDRNLNGISTSVVFPGWQSSLRSKTHPDEAMCTTKVSLKLYPATNPDEDVALGNVTFSRFTFAIDVERPFWQSLLTRFVPPAIMLVPTLATYLLQPLKMTAVKISICSGTLVTIILFHTGVTSRLPPISYLTFFDKFLFCVYLTILTVLAITLTLLMMYGDAEYDQKVGARDVRVLKKLMIWVGIVTTLFLYSIFLPAWAVMDGPEFLPMLLSGLILMGIVYWLLANSMNSAEEKDELDMLIDREASDDSGSGPGGQRASLREARRVIYSDDAKEV